jgi:hypothetical protein
MESFYKKDTIMSDKFHINPETGNPGVCRAKYNCRFGGERIHFESKEEAREDYEMRMTAKDLNKSKTIDALMNINVLPETSDWNQIEFELKAIRDAPEEWTIPDEENLASVLKLSDLLSTNKMTPEDWNKAEKIYSHMVPLTPYNKGDYKSRDRNLLNFAADLINRKRSYDYPVSNAPKREKFTSVIGLDDAQKQVVKTYNVQGYGDNKYEIIQKDAEKYLDNALDRIAAGEKYEPIEAVGRNGINNSLIPDRDRVFRQISNPDSEDFKNQLYLGTVFPERELKDSLEKAGVENVSVSNFDNGREWGLAYTVMTPDGGSRSFSVYEHRNTDSIIINGKTNWDGKDLPYAADSKGQYFAEFAPGDRKQAADALAFFMKEAQKGELDNDEELTKKAEHRDWRSILTDSVPGYGEWVEKHFPDTSITEDPRKLGF